MHALVQRLAHSPPEEMKAYGVSPSRRAGHHRAVNGPAASVVLRASVVEGFLQSRPLGGCTSRLESPDNEARLPTQGCRARRRSEARVRPKPPPGVHHEVDVAPYGASIDLGDIPGVHRPALIHDIRDRRQEPVDITPTGFYLRFVAVTSGQHARAADHNRERDVSHGRESLAANQSLNCERRTAGERLSACFIRRSRLAGRARPSIHGCSNYSRLMVAHPHRR
jgi:hypothetical protein